MEENRLSTYTREKRIECVDYQEVDIVTRSKKSDDAVKGSRKRKLKVSRPAQQNLNDKNAKRYLTQLGNANFGQGDLVVHCTYADKYLPESEEAAAKELYNFTRRLSSLRKKQGLEPLKYIAVTEFTKGTESEKPKRIHHHIVINGGLDRDLVEETWSKGRGKNKEKMGWVNADRIQVNENGIEALMMYMVKDPSRKKRWTSSHNLVKPIMRKNDWKYSRRKIEQLAKLDDQGREYFEKMYPDFDIVNIRFEYWEHTGWHCYLKMWRKNGKRGSG